MHIRKHKSLICDRWAAELPRTQMCLISTQANNVGTAGEAENKCILNFYK